MMVFYLSSLLFMFIFIYFLFMAYTYSASGRQTDRKALTPEIPPSLSLLLTNTSPHLIHVEKINGVKATGGIYYTSFLGNFFLPIHTYIHTVI
jgi:hypothetical protein